MGKYLKKERFGLASDIKNWMNQRLRNIMYAQKVGVNQEIEYINKAE